LAKIEAVMTAEQRQRWRDIEAPVKSRGSGEPSIEPTIEPTADACPITRGMTGTSRPRLRAIIGRAFGSLALQADPSCAECHQSR